MSKLFSASTEMTSRCWPRSWGYRSQPDTGAGLEAGPTWPGIKLGSMGAGLALWQPGTLSREGARRLSLEIGATSASMVSEVIRVCLVGWV